MNAETSSVFSSNADIPALAASFQQTCLWITKLIHPFICAHRHSEYRRFPDVVAIWIECFGLSTSRCANVIYHPVSDQMVTSSAEEQLFNGESGVGGKSVPAEEILWSRFVNDDFFVPPMPLKTYCIMAFTIASRTARGGM